MNIPLTPQLEMLIAKKVASGDYLSPGDVVRDALELLEERDRVREEQAAELNRQIQIGLDQFDRGESLSREQLIEKLGKMSDEWHRRG